MGRNPKPRITSLTWKPIGRARESTEAAEYLAQVYDLQVSLNLYDLIEEIQGRITRDLLDDFTPALHRQKRAVAHNIIGQVIDNVTELRIRIARLQELIALFETETGYNPPMMEDIFDVNLDPPTQPFLCDCLEQLPRLFSQPGPWNEVEDRLSAVLRVPRRDALPKGKIPHTVLKRCIGAAKLYWRELDRGCLPEALLDDAVCADNDAAAVTGDFERFAVDLLQIADAPFSLSQLKTAMR